MLQLVKVSRLNSFLFARFMEALLLQALLFARLLNTCRFSWRFLAMHTLFTLLLLNYQGWSVITTFEWLRTGFGCKFKFLLTWHDWSIRWYCFMRRQVLRRYFHALIIALCLALQCVLFKLNRSFDSHCLRLVVKCVCIMSLQGLKCRIHRFLLWFGSLHAGGFLRIKLLF